MSLDMQVHLCVGCQGHLTRACFTVYLSYTYVCMIYIVLCTMPSIQIMYNTMYFLYRGLCRVDMQALL